MITESNHSALPDMLELELASCIHWSAQWYRFVNPSHESLLYGLLPCQPIPNPFSHQTDSLVVCAQNGFCKLPIALEEIINQQALSQHITLYRVDSGYVAYTASGDVLTNGASREKAIDRSQALGLIVPVVLILGSTPVYCRKKT